MQVTIDLLNQKLKEQKLFYESILDNLPINLFLKDKEGRLFFANKATLDFTNKTIQEIIGKTDFEIFPVSVAEKLSEVDKKLRNKNISQINAIESFEKDGKRVYLYAGKVLLDPTNPKDSTILGFSFDITEQNELEIEITKQKQFLRDVINTIPHLVFVKDRHGNFILVNEAVAKVFKKNINEIEYKANDVVHNVQEELDVYASTDAQVIKHGVTINLEESLTVDGVPKIYNTIKTPIKLTDGENTVLGISTDITALKDYERLLEAQKEEISNALSKEKELNKLKSRFVSTASHEIRTPLATIQSTLDLINYKMKKEGLIKQGEENFYSESIESISSEIFQLTDLLNDTLMLSKIEAGQITVKREVINIKHLIEDVCTQYFGNQPDGRTVDLYVEGSTILFTTDKSLMRQIFRNLLSNAFKYSKDSNPTVHIYYHQKSCTIEVSDKGIGIPSKEIESIFNAFYRADNALQIEGTGLGLSIVHQLIGLLGGTISIKSVENVGTTFTINLKSEIENERNESSENIIS